MKDTNMIQALSFNLALKTSARQFQPSHLSKATSDINLNGTQYKVPFCGLILHTLVVMWVFYNSQQKASI